MFHPLLVFDFLGCSLNESGGLAYLHFIEPRVGGNSDRDPPPNAVRLLRSLTPSLLPHLCALGCVPSCSLNEAGGLAYLHFVEPRVGGSSDRDPPPDAVRCLHSPMPELAPGQCGLQWGSLVPEVFRSPDWWRASEIGKEKDRVKSRLNSSRM